MSSLLGDGLDRWNPDDDYLSYRPDERAGKRIVSGSDGLAHLSFDESGDLAKARRLDLSSATSEEVKELSRQLRPGESLEAAWSVEHPYLPTEGFRANDWLNGKEVVRRLSLRAPDTLVEEVEFTWGETQVVFEERAPSVIAWGKDGNGHEFVLVRSASGWRRCDAKCAWSCRPSLWRTVADGALRGVAFVVDAATMPVQLVCVGALLFYYLNFDFRALP